MEYYWNVEPLKLENTLTLSTSDAQNRQEEEGPPPCPHTMQTQGKP